MLWGSAQKSSAIISELGIRRVLAEDERSGKFFLERKGRLLRIAPRDCPQPAPRRAALARRPRRCVPIYRGESPLRCRRRRRRPVASYHVYVGHLQLDGEGDFFSFKLLVLSNVFL